MEIQTKRDLYAVLTPAQREKEKPSMTRCGRCIAYVLFSSQESDAADLEQTAGWGMAAASESTPRDAGKSAGQLSYGWR